MFKFLIKKESCSVSQMLHIFLLMSELKDSQVSALCDHINIKLNNTSLDSVKHYQSSVSGVFITHKCMTCGKNMEVIYIDIDIPDNIININNSKYDGKYIKILPVQDPIQLLLTIYTINFYQSESSRRREPILYKVCGGV